MNGEVVVSGDIKAMPEKYGAGLSEKDPAEPGGAAGAQEDAKQVPAVSCAGSSLDPLAGAPQLGEKGAGSLSCTPSTTLGKRTPQERDEAQVCGGICEDTMRRLEERYAALAAKGLAGASSDHSTELHQQAAQHALSAAAVALLARPQKTQRTPGKARGAAETFATAIKGNTPPQSSFASHAEQSAAFVQAGALQNAEDDTSVGGIKPDGPPHAVRPSPSGRMRAAADARCRSVNASQAGRDAVIVSNSEDMTDEYIRGFLKVEVSHESCNMIRLINTQLQQLVSEGVARFVRSEDNENCVWGFRVLEVEDPLLFNRRFRAVVPPGRDTKPLKRPTEVFMKMLRFCGVTARRGARGPRETDPDPRDFMYSFYYDYVSSKEEYNRRKLCTNGYSKEAREIAGQHKGEFLQSTLMPRRTKRASELKQKQISDEAAAAAVAQLAATAASAADGTAGGLDALFEAAVSELQRVPHLQTKQFLESTRNATLMGALLAAGGAGLSAVKNASGSSLMAAALQGVERGLEAPGVPPPPPSPSAVPVLLPAPLDVLPSPQPAVGADEVVESEEAGSGDLDKVQLCA